MNVNMFYSIMRLRISGSLIKITDLSCYYSTQNCLNCKDEALKSLNSKNLHISEASWIILTKEKPGTVL